MHSHWNHFKLGRVAAVVLVALTLHCTHALDTGQRLQHHTPHTALTNGTSSNGTLPIVIVHGWFSNNVSMGLQTLIDNLQAADTGIDLHSLNIFTDLGSLAPLTTQLPIWGKDIMALAESSFPMGFNMIGFSQGGLIGRLLLEEMSNHTVHTYISLSGPQMGQFGLPDSMKWFFPNFTTDNLYKALYTQAMQDTVSLANFWKDPFHIPEYLSLPVLLAQYNNEVASNHSEQYKSNFLRVTRFVAAAGPQDGVVVPWQSAMFSYFDSNLTVIPMQQQAVYTNDTFGLRSLGAGFIPCVVPNVDHYHFASSTDVFKLCVRPYVVASSRDQARRINRLQPHVRIRKRTV